MSSTDESPTEALIQYLRADEMLGVRDIPIRLPERAVPGSPRLPQKSAEEVADRDERLGALDAEHVKSCAKCSLSETRTKTVFGQGSSAAALMFVGEAPGFDEDRQGLAFVGKAGQLLSKMIVAMGLKREEVYICNVLKCRPPNNRDPAADEIAACCPYLYEQIGIIEPSIIVALGAPAARTLLQSKQGIGRLRGRLHDFFASGIEGVGPAIPLMPTYHPAYLLRSPGEKGKAWSDLQAVMERLGLPMPKK